MNRDQMLQRLSDASARLDILIIGGGATGLGCAVDAASRGYRTALIEQHDFAKGTSSRSTKLIHGGIRYLQQGNIHLVKESLYERGLLLRNAPRIVHPLAFIIPYYQWWEAPYYGVGVKTYDFLSGKLKVQPSRFLSAEEVQMFLPGIKSESLRGGLAYYDAQFDDAQLAIAMARTAADCGAVLVNYVEAKTLLHDTPGKVTGVEALDIETGRSIALTAKVVINATGIFSDNVRQLDFAGAQNLLQTSRGSHIVLPRSFLPGQAALMVPRTADGRVLFAIPWHEHLLVGTTESPTQRPELEPRPSPEEISFLLQHAGKYLHRQPTASDVLSAFAGLRPLVRRGNSRSALTPRDHHLEVAASGLITIVGGKWTTYRKMAQDTIDAAITVGHLPPQQAKTASLPLRDEFVWDRSSPWLHPSLPYTEAEIRLAAREQMARTVEDALGRRTRALFLDARASMEAAPAVARIMAEELARPPGWAEEQVKSFRQLAGNYLLHV